MGSDELKQKAFALFAKLKPGEIIVVSRIAQRNPKAFVEYGKAYIDDGGWIEFSGDYRKIRGLEPIDWPALKAEIPPPYIISY